LVLVVLVQLTQVLAQVMVYTDSVADFDFESNELVVQQVHVV
jgi:hypothetical protein